MSLQTWEIIKHLRKHLEASGMKVSDADTIAGWHYAPIGVGIFPLSSEVRLEPAQSIEKFAIYVSGNTLENLAKTVQSICNALITFSPPLKGSILQRHIEVEWFPSEGREVAVPLAKIEFVIHYSEEKSE